MNTLLTPLLARLTSATGVTFTLNAVGDIVVPADDAFKLAAVVEAGIVDLSVAAYLASEGKPPTEIVLRWSLTEPPKTQEEAMHERVYGLDTVMGQPRERVTKDLADKRTAVEQEKLAEAGRKSWVTRRANAAKKGGRK